jgi:hypothetical protein
MDAGAGHALRIMVAFDDTENDRKDSAVSLKR